MNRKMREQAIIIFTRAPLPGQTKTRLMPFLTGEECAVLHRCFLLDVCAACARVNAELLVFYTPEEHKNVLTDILGEKMPFLPQRGDDLGERMAGAFEAVFRMGYERAILIGTDIPQVEASALKEALDALSLSEAVIAPTPDGGYYLIGMKTAHRDIWDLRRYGSGPVFFDTLEQLERCGLKTEVGRLCRDIDTKEDLLYLYEKVKSSTVLQTLHTGRYMQNELREKLERLKAKDYE